LLADRHEYGDLACRRSDFRHYKSAQRGSQGSGRPRRNPRPTKVAQRHVTKPSRRDPDHFLNKVALAQSVPSSVSPSSPGVLVSPYKRNQRGANKCKDAATPLNTPE
jgi:hypothetical protein